ncbi:MAG TPA: DUF5666 domain-containing protein [Burkholderiaceae bacterium]|nr:DUF5666 domain-containing protein [Burkholderiaceae bacterium]
MNRSSTHSVSRRAGRLIGAVLAAVALASCGGGDGVIGSGGTGSPLGMAVGTVNGFGSVIVDGVRYDDRASRVVVEVAPGVDAIGEVRLGDRVSVEYEVAGVAKTVRLEAAAVGRVDSVDAPDRFSMLGQSVSINVSGTAGPITQIGDGYAQASDLRSGDFVEVHGLLVRQGGVVQIQATRIDKLAVAPAYLRVSGIVGALQTGAATSFTIGGLTVDGSSAPVLPSGTALANGQAVTVMALPSGLTPPAPAGRRLLAAQIRVRELRDEGLEDTFSGAVSHLDSAAKSFQLGGQRVDYRSATLAPAGWTPADGQYVLVSGTVATDGSLRASSVSQRDTGSEDEAELHGNITGYDAATGRFSVRDVLVDASAATLEGCPVSGLVNGLYVEIEGSLGSNGVTARKLKCGDEPVDAAVEREGIAASVDTASRSFALATGPGASVPVRWTEATYFGELTPATLSGQQVKVEGSFVDGVLVARKIKRDD